MAYTTKIIAARTCAMVLERPGIKLISVCRQLGVDRHTITRALRTQLGVSYRQFQSQSLRTRVDGLRAEGLHSVKETAFLLGYSSPAAMSRRYRQAGDERAKPDRPSK